MADLGQIFTRLGEMFGGVGTTMAAGGTSTGQLRLGPAGRVELDQVPSRPSRQPRNSAIADPCVATPPARAGPASLPPAGAARRWLEPPPTGSTTPWLPKSGWCDPMAPADLTVQGVAGRGQIARPAAVMSQMGGIAFSSQLGQALGRLSRTV